MDEREWKDQAKRLNLNFPGQELRPESLVSWYDEGDLVNQPAWLMALAVRRIVRTHDYPPRTIAGLLCVIDEVRGEMAREQAEDATRTCPGCAIEDIPGWVETTEGWYPCGDCRPGRHEAFRQMRDSGWPDSKTGRNWMTAPLDKATGFPKIREVAR